MPHTFFAQSLKRQFGRGVIGDPGAGRGRPAGRGSFSIKRIYLHSNPHPWSHRRWGTNAIEHRRKHEIVESSGEMSSLCEVSGFSFGDKASGESSQESRCPFESEGISRVVPASDQDVSPGHIQLVRSPPR